MSEQEALRRGAEQRRQDHIREGSLVVSFALPAGALEQVARRAAELVLEQLDVLEPAVARPYITIPEAAVYIGAGSRQRVDDLLSQGRLTRVKDGKRTLIERAEIDAYLAGEPTGRVAHRLPNGSQSRMGRRVAR